MGKWGTYGNDEGNLDGSSGLAFDSYDNLYISDTHNNRIQKFTKDSEKLTVFGSENDNETQLKLPLGITIDYAGDVYVADWGNERVQVLDPEGGFVIKLRGESTLSVWAENFLCINVEEGEARARANLEPEMEFFNNDPHEESSHIEKYFGSLVSVKLDDAGKLYVTEGNRHRIQVYERGK